MYKIHSLLPLVIMVAGSTFSAAEDSRFIEVTGEASLNIRPDTFRITAILSADDEKSSVTALKKFEEIKSKFNSALNPMIFEKVQVSYEQTKIGNTTENQEQQVMLAMDGDAPEAPDFVVKESALVSRSGLDGMSEVEVKRLVARLSDTIVKHGGKLGPEYNNMFGFGSLMPQGSVSYSISDPEAHTEKVQSAAMANARKKAAALAKLSGGTVGRVLFVKEGFTIGDTDTETQQAFLMMQAYGIDMQNDSFSTDSFKDISVRSNLKVRFELLDE